MMTLLPADRCDRCGARACVSATLAGGELLLCGHHASEHDAALREAGATIRDDRLATTTPRPANL